MFKPPMNNPLTPNPHTSVTIPRYLFCSATPTNSLLIIKTGYILDVLGLLYEILKILIFYLILISDTKGPLWLILLPGMLFCWLLPYLTQISSYQKASQNPSLHPETTKKRLNQIFHVILNSQSWATPRLLYSALQILWSLWSSIWLSIYLTWTTVQGVSVEGYKKKFTGMLVMELVSVLYWSFLVVHGLDVGRARFS
jgi:hypothetical protein